jgi:hypothetical protein
MSQSLQEEEIVPVPAGNPLKPEKVEPELQQPEHTEAQPEDRVPKEVDLWQPMREPDCEQFKAAMEQEITDHTKNRHWGVILKKDIPKRTLILPAIWSMKWKRRITMIEVYNWRARLAIDGSKQKYGRQYDETYIPVVTWASTWFFLILHGWHSIAIRFSTGLLTGRCRERTVHGNTKSITVEGPHDRDKYALRILKRLYGQKQAGRVWYQYLV